MNRHEFSAMLFFMALVGGILKDIVNSPRPPGDRVWRVKQEEDNGFPSSHSMNAVGLALFTLLTFWPVLGEYRLVATLLAACWSVLVPLSRFYNGVHSWPDIVGGALMGVISALLFFGVDGIAAAARQWPGAVVALLLALMCACCNVQRAFSY
jgi:membrane-associated phospholipid phosphatase